MDSSREFLLPGKISIFSKSNFFQSIKGLISGLLLSFITYLEPVYLLWNQNIFPLLMCIDIKKLSINKHWDKSTTQKSCINNVTCLISCCHFFSLFGTLVHNPSSWRKRDLVRRCRGQMHEARSSTLAASIHSLEVLFPDFWKSSFVPSKPLCFWDREHVGCDWTSLSEWSPLLQVMDIIKARK